MKYELIEFPDPPFTGARRVRATENFGDVKIGDLGGWVKAEHNLGYEGSCWVYDDACVYESGLIHGDVQIRENACVRGKARLYDRVVVRDNALVCDNAVVWGTTLIQCQAIVDGMALLPSGNIVGRIVSSPAECFNWSMTWINKEEIIADSRIFNIKEFMGINFKDKLSMRYDRKEICKFIAERCTEEASSCFGNITK